MPASSLHPNLARLASLYDDVLERYAHRQLSATQARDQILALVARDDNGVMWSINPDSGRWQYRSIDNILVEATPPGYGYATMTPFELSDEASVGNPDRRISFYEVDEAMLVTPGRLAGRTQLTGPRRRRFLLVAAVAAGVTAVLVLLLI